MGSLFSFFTPQKIKIIDKSGSFHLHTAKKGLRGRLVYTAQVEKESCAGMGNRESSHSLRRRSTSKKEETSRIPHITVIQASPLPAQESMFDLPEPAHTGTLELPGGRQQHTRATSRENQQGLSALIRVSNSRRSQHGTPSSPEGSDDGQNDGATTPKGSRAHFIEVMMHSSPHVRRSVALRNSVHLSSRSEDSQSDSDSVSLVSSNLEEERNAITLDPLEHEWMICASDGEWDNLQALLSVEPGLALRKDFVTGFTCLHWAAKLGKPELIALIINFAKQHALPIDVNVRSSNGYTPLHVAAMHNSTEVVKLLVDTYNANVDLRDYSGRKACQYNTANHLLNSQDMVGERKPSNAHSVDGRDGDRWRYSKILQQNLKPVMLRAEREDEVNDRRQKKVRRRSTFATLRPKLRRMRARTSQIVNSVSLSEPHGGDDTLERSRPKSHWFGKK